MKDASAAIAIVLVMSCAMLSPAQTRTDQPQANARNNMLVSTAWLQEHLADRDLVIVYVGRSRSSYDAGHIPGSRFLALDKIVEQHDDSLNELPPVAVLQAVFESVGVGDDSKVVLYGEGGGLLAARAYFTLDYLGHTDRAALLDGGLEKWVAEERPTDRYPVRAPRTYFTANVQPQILVTTSHIREITISNSGDYLLLDARPPQEYDGWVASEAVPKAGHLPGAQSLYWKTLLKSDSSLLDIAQLQQAFAQVGAQSDREVMTYCRTGMQSSFAYFVAKYLGYRAAMYDGSVYEWVHRGGYDLVRTELSITAPPTTP